MELNQWFEKGLSVQQYIENMKVNEVEMKQIFQSFSLSAEEKERIAHLKEEGFKVIVLSEDWCGDALLNNPILLKIAEEINMEVRFILRDQNLELMDQYLTNGTSRAIPIFIFINQAGEELAVWGPRAQQIQEMVNHERSQLPSQEDPEFKDKQMAMYKKFKASYLEDSTLWHIVADNIIDTISKIK
ncbi:thioredoxin family protein [Bacillus sp. S/N-304-OC-R1]|uniref:thioredoxin family protein n=1 Tax=Bacillus sp. S/N-304-OC-R1 TaxID=2758034 RepID=UPI001C8E44B3|nr:thioredoxin family protein [Bacillus sp. S/N-304-OC-R1]MBY0122212.1 thioredoxin family protein [Bacillus sp. S/N-304-OC-R1]